LTTTLHETVIKSSS